VPAEDFTDAFQEFTRNLEYARNLVDGGRRLAQLRVGAFDVHDLYRAAWVQAVAALDHWITREIVDRAVALAQDPSAIRPPKFNKIAIPVELFERVHHQAAPLDEAFRAHFEQTFGYMTFQSPEKIKDGFAHVSTINLWLRVAEIMDGDRSEGERVTPDIVRSRLREIAWRRNNIAHTADWDADSPTQRAAITADETVRTLDWLKAMATAVHEAVGRTTRAPDYDSAPEEAGGLGDAPASRSLSRVVPMRGTSVWSETDLLKSIEDYSTPPVAGTLLSVYRHAESHPAFRGYYFGEAAHPSVTAWFGIASDEAAVWSIYTGVSKSVLSVNFQWMRDRGAARERLAELADALSALPGWANIPIELQNDGYGRRPSLGPAALSAPSAAEIITRALNAFLSPTGPEPASDAGSRPDRPC
jgi:hypothetical protein